MLRIVADSKIPFLKGALEPVAEVTYLPGREISPSHVRDADALIVRTRTKCNAGLLQGSTVKYIATATIGHDHIDAEYCASKGIAWSNAPGCNSSSVQQYVASALCYIAQRDAKPFSSYTIGIVGVGHVGKKVEALARSLGMTVLLNDPPRQAVEGPDAFTPLNELLAQSDIVTLHVPLSRDGEHPTYHLASNEFFARIKPDAWFINAARGEVASTDSIKNAIRKGTIKGVVLDVWEQEPAIDPELLRLAFLATPHIAGYSLDGKANGTAQSVQALSQFFSLGMDNWYPSSIPEPAEPSIALSGAHCNGEFLIQRLIQHTYDINTDSQRLKDSIKLFEQLRDEYPPRREFKAFSIFSEDTKFPALDVLEGLGFGVKRMKFIND